jgi:NitT/TauT family transport system substrate-binding protein
MKRKKCFPFAFLSFFRNFARDMKQLMIMAALAALLAACGQSYEETKRIARENRREAARKDSAALKIAVMPTLDCLPMYVARHYQLLDSAYGGVRLKVFNAQMDCDTAMLRGRVEGCITDLVRAKNMERQGLKLRYTAATNAYWQLISNRNVRVRQLKQLEDKMVAMTRFSATDYLSDRVVDSVKLQSEHVFRVQINDVSVRMLMLQNNEMDALWLTEPWATAARNMKHHVIMDSRKFDVQLGVMVFREQEMRHPERSRQLQLFIRAYDQACDSINKYGVAHFRNLIVKTCGVKGDAVDSLPQSIRYQHAHGPRERDVQTVERWLDRVKGKVKK